MTRSPHTGVVDEEAVVNSPCPMVVEFSMPGGS
jgi:hypothetical protein